MPGLFCQVLCQNLAYIISAWVSVLGALLQVVVGCYGLGSGLLSVHLQ